MSPSRMKAGMSQSILLAIYLFQMVDPDHALNKTLDIHESTLDLVPHNANKLH